MIVFDRQNETLTNHAGECFDIVRQNTSLYTFWGNAALYDHVFIEVQRISQKAPDYIVPRSQYIFSFEETYKELYDFVVAKKFQQIVNINQPMEHDMDAFFDHLQQSLQRGSDR
jgi:hypothetical protein